MMHRGRTKTVLVVIPIILHLRSMSTEIEIMKRVRHRHVCSMFELYESPKCLWIILELVDGGDLHKLLATSKHYSEDLASRHMEQMCKVGDHLRIWGIFSDLPLFLHILRVCTIFIHWVWFIVI